jgi:hypothetical protein
MRLFEGVDSILKFYYHIKLLFGVMRWINSTLVRLLKQDNRTNANDGGIDFVMKKPLDFFM